MFDRELDYYGIPSTEGIATQESLAEAIEYFSEDRGDIPKLFSTGYSFLFVIEGFAVRLTRHH
jgi:hypothetical protein